MTRFTRKGVPPLRNLLVGLHDHHDFNAYASTSKGGDFIVINSAVPIMLVNMFAMILSDPMQFAYILPASDDSVPTFVKPATIHQNLYNLGATVDVSLTEARAELALSMTTACLNFLFAHEKAHLLNGHLNFKRSFGGKAQLSIFEESRNDEVCLSMIDYQTLEFDADKSALLNSLALSICLMSGQKEFKELFGSQSTVIAGRMCIFALFCLFQLIELLEPSELRQHPPASVRMSYLMPQAAGIFEGLNNDLGAYDAASILPKADMGWSVFTGQPVLASSNFLSKADESQKHISALEDNWEKMRSKLAPFCRGRYGLVPV